MTHPTRALRRLGLTWRGWLLVALLIAALAGLVATAWADEGDEGAARYVPSARGTRPAVTRWTEMVSAYDWDVATALRVIDCESGGDPEAVNPYSGATGLFQLYRWGFLARRLFGESDVLIPWVNVAVAHVLWADSGGTFRWHWSSSRGCWG